MNPVATTVINPLKEYWPRFKQPSPMRKTFENIVGKGENAGNHNVFSPPMKKFQFLGHIYFVVCKCFEFRPV